MKLLSSVMMVAVVGVSAYADPVGARPAPKAPEQAKPKPTPVIKDAPLPATVGANEIMKLTPPAGFIDDVVAFENQRVAYVIADTSSKAELHVVQLGCAKCADEKKEIVVDLSPVTLRPLSVRFVGQGRVFVVGDSDGKQIGALLDLAKSPAAPVYKVGPATHINVMKRDNAQRVVAHFADPTKTGVKHHVEVFALETGKRLVTSKALELEGEKDKRTDLTVNHWTDGYTHAVGTKGGDWVKKENQRSPDTEATYDLVSGKFVENKPISDLFEQRKRFQVLAADGNGQADFFRLTPDNLTIQLWRAGQMKTVDLDQPLSNYDSKSLQGIINADGSAWLALKVDPVNADAVARKKADPEYLDIFKVGADGKASRKGRILAKGLKHKFGVVGDMFWLLERSTGFDRGGKTLTIFSLAS